MQDGPAGVRATDGVTGFPPGIAVASTFSKRLMRARGEAIAQEFRGKGVKCVESPPYVPPHSPTEYSMYLGPAMDLVCAAK